MSQVRDCNAILGKNEIEAIKVNQEIIKRLADNSQKIKNIFLVSCGVLVALGESGFNFGSLSITCLLVFAAVFWYMDAKYLQIERQFRVHHREIVNGTLGFLEMWKFNPKEYPKDNIFKVMLSFSLFLYPAVILLVIIFFLSTDPGTCVFNPTANIIQAFVV